MITLTDVSKDYTQGSETVRALRPTTLTISGGEFCAILGPSGSGKSTLLTIMGGLLTPSTGQVCIDGVDLTAISRKELSRQRFTKLGFILQSSSLVPFLTVQDQMIFHAKVAGTTPDTRRRDELMERLDITRLANKYPDALSGGERQRVAIATALMHDPAVILADEPTVALDTARAFETVKLLRDLTHEDGRATIMVTHDERLIDYCDAVYRMHDGELSRDTTAERGRDGGRAGDTDRQLDHPICLAIRRRVPWLCPPRRSNRRG